MIRVCIFKELLGKGGASLVSGVLLHCTVEALKNGAGI